MTRARHGSGLLFESLMRVRTAIDAGAQHLDRDRAADSRVARPVDFAHASGTQSGLDLVGTDTCATPERHGWKVVVQKKLSISFRSFKTPPARAAILRQD
jgi:hypothetical protein